MIFKNKNFDLTISYIDRTLFTFKILASVVMSFEIVFLIIGILFLDGNTVKKALYLSSYIFLAVLCLITLIVFGIYKRSNGKTRDITYVMYYLFFTGFFLWSVMISVLDTGYDTGSTVMVYMTVTMAIGMIMTIHPIYYFTVATLGLGALVFVPYMISGSFMNLASYSNIVVYYIFSILVNINAYKLHEREYDGTQKLIESSVKDSLTGLYNRRYFDIKEKELLADKGGFTLILTDIDNFKQINDSHGHLIGDNSIMLIAELIKKRFGSNIVRYGGDEFAIFTDLSADESAIMIKKVNEELAKRNPDFPLHISAGIYERQSNESTLDVIRFADLALYEAKDSGKSTAKIYK